MALCDKPCCNAEARAAIRAKREAEFEAYLAARAGVNDLDANAAAVEGEVPVAEANDLSYGEAFWNARQRAVESL